jgi:hypothetical protein
MTSARLRLAARVQGALAIVLALLPAAPAAAADLRAEQITEANVGELQIGGPDAIGGVGDWYLANDVVEIVVDDPSRRFGKRNHGGAIVDVGLRDRRGEDQFAELFPLLNLDQRVELRFDTIRAEVDPGGAWARLLVSDSQGPGIVARGSWLSRALDPLVPDPAKIAGVRIETEYTVLPGEPFVRITTTIRNEGSRPAPVFAYADVLMRGGLSMRAWVANTLWPERSRGFSHMSFDRTNILGAGSAMASFTYVAIPGAAQFPPIGYAIYAPERTARGIPSYGVTSEHVNVITSFLSDPDWQELGALRLLGATRGELAPGEVWSYPRRLLVTGRADVASATDVIFPALGVADGASGIRGSVEPAGERAVVEVRSRSGVPVTEMTTRTEGPDAGRFAATLPPGDYTLLLRAEHRPEQRIDVAVAAGAFHELPTQRLAPIGFLRFEPAFADGGPGRVIVRGVAPTPDPVFGAELLDFRIDGRPAKSGTERHDLYFVGGRADPKRIAIAPGRYRLTATRGLEWGLDYAEVEVPGDGAEVRVEPFHPVRASELSGIVSADLHVHAEASDDSAMPNATRLASYAAEGIDVIVSSDHDNLGVFAPALAALGLSGRIRVIQGVEATSSAPSAKAPWTLGHSNAWPMRLQPTAHRRGAPPTQDRTLADLYAELRERDGARVIQLNHPMDKLGGVRDDEAYLTHIGADGLAADSQLPLEEAPNDALLETGSDGHTRAIDFDAIELMNGDSREIYLAVRKQWHSFLRQGLRRTATANSDTHGPGQVAAYPHNYVYIGTKDEDRSDASFDAAIRAGRLFGTNGPLIAAFRVNGARMGDDVKARDGQVDVEIAVAAAPWVPVDEVRLLVNGDVVRSWRDLPQGPAPPVLRLEQRIELPIVKDCFVTVEAGAPLEADRATWAAQHAGAYADVVAPGFVPTAFTNPIWVDADGDGRVAAAGLPPKPIQRARVFGGGGLLVALAGGLFWRRRRARSG